MESKIRDLRQEIFKFEQLSNFDKNDFFVSECNYFAFNLIKSWPNWEKKILNVYGERKSGKSHLTEIFLEDKKGIKLKFKELNEKIFDKIKGHENIVIEDFNEKCDEEATYSLIDIVEKENKYLLITSVKAVNEMGTRLKDLNSRFKNILTAKIDKPDDELIYALKIKNFSDSQIIFLLRLINFISKKKS
jgi:ATPase involved in DNA replication initiation